MEKRTYTVEWLSESSKKSCTHPNVAFKQHKLAPGSQFKDRDNVAMSTGGQNYIPNIGYRRKDNYGVKKLLVDDRAAAPLSLKQISQVTFYNKGGAELAKHKLKLNGGSYILLTKCFCDVPNGGRNKLPALREVSATRSSPLKDDDVCSDVDSLKSTESTASEDDASSSRPRTKFTEEQLQELEKSFLENRYIGASEKKRLSRVLKLSETQIKTWFQNRRMKYKRQKQDARVDAIFSRLYFPYYGYPDIQTQSCSLQPDVAMPVPLAPLPPQPATLPYSPMHAAIRAGLPGHHPPTNILPPTNFRPCPLPSMYLRPMLNEGGGVRYSQY
ncbi:homeobox vex1-like [Pelobates cultripes]|uniref:Homeobox vex1-like n=1 Tax=Pelobates cultripes TaxID=61616 RepID=A0AAD1TD50_PELCU|nr:homeobox vex1-like [Pelobates cultripes]